MQRIRLKHTIQLISETCQHDKKYFKKMKTLRSQIRSLLLAFNLNISVVSSLVVDL